MPPVRRPAVSTRGPRAWRPSPPGEQSSRAEVPTLATMSATARPTYRLPFVITASSAGTIIEWYDFYLYGVLAAFFSTQFFPKGNDTAALLASLATFGAGFAVRPFGAAVFGRIGDLTGRKFTFLLTITIMGLSTALVGFLPTYAQIGILAPIILVTLRLQETPLFSRLKAAGNSSTSPWRDSLGDTVNRRLIILALLGATAGQAVVWYQGQFQSLFFLGTVLGVKYIDAYLIVGTAIVL